jgi:hypothetical protein
MLRRMPTGSDTDAPRDTRRPVTNDGPPRLRLHVMHHLKVLVLLNILPLLGCGYLWWQWSQGKLSMRSMTAESRTTLVVVLVCGVAFAVISWFVMPLARWLRDYPTWHFRRGPAWAWAIPTASGWLAWAALTMAGMLGAAAAILVAILGIWHLFHQTP